MFLDLHIWVFINGEFLYRIKNPSLIGRPTEYIDVSCELAAAVVPPWFVHLLQLLPLVSVDVIPMTVSVQCSHIFVSTSYIDEFGVYNTHASVVQFHVIAWCNFSATEYFGPVACEHSALFGVLMCLEDLIPTNLDRSPVIKVKC